MDVSHIADANWRVFRRKTHRFAKFVPKMDMSLEINTVLGRGWYVRHRCLEMEKVLLFENGGPAAPPVSLADFSDAQLRRRTQVSVCV